METNEIATVGQLTGEGASLVAIGDRDGKVVLQFPRAVSWIALDPQNAFDIGEAIARNAHKARFGSMPPEDASYIAQQVRARITEDLQERLVTRGSHVIRSLLEQGRPAKYIAAEVMRVMLREVT